MDDKEMFMVVGFEVLACSIQRSPGQKPTDISCTETGKPTKPQEVTKGAHKSPSCSAYRERPSKQKCCPETAFLDAILGSLVRVFFFPSKRGKVP